MFLGISIGSFGVSQAIKVTNWVNLTAMWLLIAAAAIYMVTALYLLFKK